MADVPSWRLKGEWFDACRCTVPCPCTFAQPPTEGECDGFLIWHIDDGNFGDVQLAGLNLAAVARFSGNIWDEGTKMDMGLLIDSRADERQQQAMQTIFSGQAGGWPAMLAEKLGNLLGMETAEMDFEVAEDLSSWRAEVNGKAKAEVKALDGPTLEGGKRTQVHDPPGSECGPGTVATYGTATTDEADAFGLNWARSGRSSKHMAFEWSGPE